MNTVGIIAEYNPFHLGHRYHLEMSKKITNSKYSIAVITGSFVQRGEPSIVDKWTKAKTAIDNGVDLVIELPFIFSAQSAELFAYGGISLLDKLNVIDYIVFGSEYDDLKSLLKIAKILIEEPPYYKQNLKKYLNAGLSFPIARLRALKDFFFEYKCEDLDSTKIDKLLSLPNNILSVEYLKALIRLNSKIKPIALKRIGSHYSEVELNNKIASATAIRNMLLKNNKLNYVKDYIPYETYTNLIDYLDKYESFNSLYNYNQIIHYLLRIGESSKLANIMDVESGLENRIIDKSCQYNDINDFIQSVVTKRYTKSRIQRILIHLMMDLEKDLFYELYSHYPAYIRVLGANENGFKLLSRIKEKSSLPIITKYSDYHKYNNTYIDKMISFDKRATDLFFLGLNSKKPFSNMDYYKTPYIKKTVL